MNTLRKILLLAWSPSRRVDGRRATWWGYLASGMWKFKYELHREWGVSRLTAFKRSLMDRGPLGPKNLRKGVWRNVEDRS